MRALLPYTEQENTFEWGETVSYPGTRSLKLFTHKIFNRYPARSISLVPRQLLNTYRKSNGVGTVLDPFMGSGTTAIEGLLSGFNVLGVEIDPFARLITEVSTKFFSKGELQSLQNTFNAIMKSWDAAMPREEYIPNLSNIRYWFSEENFADLLKLKTCIYQLCEDNWSLKFFKLVFADIIRPCSKAERQTLKPYISKRFEKVSASVHASFNKSFKSYFEAICEFSNVFQDQSSLFTWSGNNALNFQTNEAVDIAITSPPYLNSIDYTRCIKLESAWIDCSDDDIIKVVKNNQVGDESRKTKELSTFDAIKPYVDEIACLDLRRAFIATKYFDDIFNNLSRVYESLRVGGSYHMIIGNSSIRGVPIPTHELIAKLGELVGFEWSGYFQYKIKDHRLSIPRQNNATGGKIEYEHVITLQKI